MLVDRWSNPRPLGLDHFVYRGQCLETPCAYQAGHEVDAEGNPLKTEAQVVTEVAEVMATPAHGPIVLCRQHTKAVINALFPSLEAV
jgi:hypothetical protein